MKIKLNPIDVLFSRLVRLMADNHCEYCGKQFYDRTRENGDVYPAWKYLQTSHFHGRRKASTRYDFDNVVAVCYSCHNHFHEHPNKYDAFMRKRLGSERYDLLNIRAETILKRAPSDKKALTESLKAKIKEVIGVA